MFRPSRLAPLLIAAALAAPAQWHERRPAPAPPTLDDAVAAIQQVFAREPKVEYFQETYEECGGEENTRTLQFHRSVSNQTVAGAGLVIAYSYITQRTWPGYPSKLPCPQHSAFYKPVFDEHKLTVDDSHPVENPRDHPNEPNRNQVDIHLSKLKPESIYVEESLVQQCKGASSGQEFCSNRQADPPTYVVWVSLPSDRPPKEPIGFFNRREDAYLAAEWYRYAIRVAQQAP